VRQRFDSTANADLGEIYAVLLALGKLRNKADYDLSASFASTGIVQQAINDAAVALKRLEDINADAARRSAAVADIRARWP